MIPWAPPHGGQRVVMGINFLKDEWILTTDDTENAEVFVFHRMFLM